MLTDSEPSPEELLQMEADRSAFLTRILDSTARRKLIVASPGTGKTYTFRLALQRAGDKGLALTFIRLLVKDLEGKLADVAEVFTFHGYCKHLLHRLALPDMPSSFDLYPPLGQLLASDLGTIGVAALTDDELTRALHELDDQAGYLSAALRIGTYYRAAGFMDLVYRVFVHLRANPEQVPQYPIVVVDEYQDFSRLESAFIGLLADRSPILIAGDDDQSLYGFKHASADFLRELAKDARYTQFELPYCSRCTAVIVDAVQAVIAAARHASLLQGRLERSYLCYHPTKLTDSRRYPRLIHARCSVQRTSAPYMGRYVAEQIASIPPEDLAESIGTDPYPTALVVGPKQFVKQVHAYLVEHGYPQAVFQESTNPLPQSLDAYGRLGRDPRSRLGWRILLATVPITEAATLISQALQGAELVDLLPREYTVKHLRIAELVRKVTDDETMTNVEVAELKTSLNLAPEAVRRRLSGATVAASEADAPAGPTIVCTTLVGAKGLSAGHVFVVGVNNGHFPQNPQAISDEDVCKLIVALSRTRKSCHLISCNRFGVEQLADSLFLKWLGPFLETRQVNAAYWNEGRSLRAG